MGDATNGSTQLDEVARRTTLTSSSFGFEARKSTGM
jgi:hypothetical protein